LEQCKQIKTIGDAYFCVGGLDNSQDTTHPERVVSCALEMVKEITKHNLMIRAGAHTGTVVGGVIGKTKFAFDLWGDSVNTSSRMESTGVPGRVQISDATYQRIKHIFQAEKRSDVKVKGKGILTTYLVIDPSVQQQQLSLQSNLLQIQHNEVAISQPATPRSPPTALTVEDPMIPMIEIDVTPVGQTNENILSVASPTISVTVPPTEFPQQTENPTK